MFHCGCFILCHAVAVIISAQPEHRDLSSLHTQGSFPDESAPSKCKRFLFGFWQKILFPLPNVIAMLSVNLMLDLLNNFTVKNKSDNNFLSLSAHFPLCKINFKIT